MSRTKFIGCYIASMQRVNSAYDDYSSLFFCEKEFEKIWNIGYFQNSTAFPSGKTKEFFSFFLMMKKSKYM